MFFSEVTPACAAVILTILYIEVGGGGGKELFCFYISNTDSSFLVPAGNFAPQTGGGEDAGVPS